MPAGSSLLTGFLKIEKQRPDGVFDDVTVEILNLGITGRNLSNGTLDTPDTGTCTAEPSPNAIIRLQHIRDVPTGGFAPCGFNAGSGNVSQVPSDYWPNVLYDAREGNLRDSIGTGTQTLFLGGLMH